MPSRGECPYIQEALESVCQNTLLPSEVIVINDGMSQSAIDALYQFDRKLNLRVVNNNGHGLVDALNTGLEEASGDFIARLDNDDLMLPQRLKTQIHEFRINSGMVALGSECIYINPAGEEIGKSNYPTGVLNSLPSFKVSCLLAHPSTMYRRDEAIFIGGYRKVFSWNGTDIGEDFDFWLRLAKCGEVINIPFALTKYRQHGGQLSMLNLAGQQIGTPFIAAINLIPEEINSRMSFDIHATGDVSRYLSIIGRAFGSIQKGSLWLLILTFKLEVLGFRLMPKIIRKLQSLIKQIVPSLF
jgi:glycosyltransferase involved in cell wall biosynthesis